MFSETYPYAGWAAVCLGVYSIAMLGVGVWASRKAKSVEDYIVAGRKLNFPLLFGTILATWCCGGIIMGGMAEAYLVGFQGSILDPIGSVVFLMFAPMFYCIPMCRGRYLTISDMIASRFGKHASFVSSISVALHEIFWVTATVTAFGSLLSTFLGWPLWVGIVTGGLVIIVYTYQGGMWAVTVTDFIQMILLSIGMAAMFLVTMGLVGGWDSFLAKAACREAANPFIMWPGEHGFYGWTGWLAWSYMLSGVLTGMGADISAQDYWERALAGKNEKTVIWASFAAGIAYLVLGMLPYFIGIAAYELNPNLTGSQIDGVAPYLLVNYFHPAMAIFISVAIAAAIMSSADSGLLALASLCGKNLQEIFKSSVTDDEILLWTKRWVPIGGLICLLLAVFFQEIFRVAVFGHAIVAVGVFPMITLGLFSKKTNSLGALAGLYGGFVAWLGASVYIAVANNASFWDTSEIALLPAVIFSFVLVWAVSILTHEIDPPKPLVDIDGKPIDTKRILPSLKFLFGKDTSTKEMF